MTARLEEPVSLVLAPIDQGVRNVDGREGAREGPEALLEGLEDAGHLAGVATVERVDVGNAPETLEDDLDALSEAVEAALGGGRTPVVLGGDHGTTYATVRGAQRILEPPVGVTYLDVHFDLRAYQGNHTSGSSFRRLIEEEIVPPDRVLPIGIEAPSTPEARKRASYDELEAYANAQGIPWIPLGAAKQHGPGRIVEQRLQTGSWCASLDADAIDEAHAPGVSAPGPGRFSPDQARAFLQAASSRVQVLDMVEYAPPLDEKQRTLDTLVDLLGSILPDGSSDDG